MIPRYKKPVHQGPSPCHIQKSNPYHKQVVDRRGQYFRDFDSLATVKGTSWNLRNLTSHRQGVVDKNIKKTEL